MRRTIIFFGILAIAAIGITAVSGFTYDFSQDVPFELFDDAKDSECSSIFLQVGENESVSSFRRDENHSASIFIENGTWGNTSYIKQYKLENGEFFQCIITEDGYTIGVGGGTDGQYNKRIENLSAQMVLSKQPLNYIQDVQDILAGYKKGHFIIKDPEGHYWVAWPTGAHSGKLDPGQYICVPNMEKYSFSGNFSRSNPIEEAINIASTDPFGIERRDIVTYHYMSNESGKFVDVYGSNDDGSKRLSNTGNLKDDITFLGKFYSADSLPAIPDKIHLGTYTFEEKEDFWTWLWNAMKK